MMDQQERAVREIMASQSPHGLVGVYRGRVENDKDPLSLGRVQVRVFAIHGNGTRYPSEVLPWADVASQGGGGYDYGSDDTPPVGSWVFVMFEGGNEEFPVVVGGARGRPVVEQEMITRSGKLSDGRDDAQAGWVPTLLQSESAKETQFEQPDAQRGRNRRVWQKSHKGHTICISDQDGEEYLKIIDRSGQIIEMRCPTPEAENNGNVQQRGIRTVDRGDALSPNNTVVGGAYIRIMDLSGNEFLMEPTKGQERVRIRNQALGGTKAQEIVMSMEGGKPTISVTGAEKDGLTIQASGETPVRLYDHAGNQILFRENASEDGIAPGVHIKAAGEITLDGTNVRFLTQSNQAQTIKGNQDKVVLGNSVTGVGNDKIDNVGGNVQRVVGGVITETIANTPLDGSVPEFAHDRVIVNPVSAGDRISIQGIGDIVREIVGIGGFTWNTTAGGVEIVSALPDPRMPGAINAHFKVQMGGAPLPTVLEITPLGDISFNSGGAVPATWVLAKATGAHTQTGFTSVETYTTSKAINAPLIQLGPNPIAPVMLFSPATAQTFGLIIAPIIEAWLIGGGVLGNMGAPLAPGPLAGTLGALIDAALLTMVSTSCFVSP